MRAAPTWAVIVSPAVETPALNPVMHGESVCALQYHTASPDPDLGSLPGGG